MNSHLKKFCFIGMLGFFMTAWAEPQLDPISVSIDRLNNNPPDPVELAYIGVRCGALNVMIGYAHEYQGNGSAEFKKMEKIFKDDGEIFKNVGFYMSIVAKEREDYRLKQFESFLHIYGDEWTQSQKLNNTAWTPFIYSEVRSCESVKPQFKSMSETINKKYPKRKHG
jgi:hypothetical protein